MELDILGICTAVPKHAMSQDEAAAMSDELIARSERESRLLRTLFRKSGVVNRYTCVPHRSAYDLATGNKDNNLVEGSERFQGPTTGERMLLYAQYAGPLAEQAAAAALQAGHISAREITHLVTVSCTGFYAPGIDIQLLHSLGMSPGVARLHIGYMGCHGAINALRAAQGLAAASPTAKVLVCAVELCSLHYRFNWDAERIIGNALFADGAAALVLARSDAGEAREWRVSDTGSCVFPGTASAITWRIGEYGFEMTLSADLPDAIQAALQPWLAGWLDQHGLTIAGVRSWAIHPGGPRVLDAVEESLGLDRAATQVSREVLSAYGNMSSPTIVFILERLRRQNLRPPCIALGFGPGLAAEAALFL